MPTDNESMFTPLQAIRDGVDVHDLDVDQHVNFMTRRNRDGSITAQFTSAGVQTHYPALAGSDTDSNSQQSDLQVSMDPYATEAETGWDRLLHQA